LIPSAGLVDALVVPGSAGHGGDVVDMPGGLNAGRAGEQKGSREGDRGGWLQFIHLFY